MCDPECNNAECNYDDSDCEREPPYDPSVYCVEACKWTDIGDKTCNVACNVTECYNDRGDCIPELLPNATHCADGCSWN